MPVPITLDVADAIDLAGPVEIGGAVFVPPGGAQPGMPVVCCFPGGTYTWRYYHLDVPGAEGYSLAGHLARRGCLVIAFDHLGIGGSTPFGDESALTPQRVLAADRAATVAAIDRVRAGMLVDGLAAVDAPYVIGVGHSMGGFLVTRHQAEYRTFDAVAVLGWSQQHATPSTSGSGVAGPSADHGGGLMSPDRRQLHAMFHADDVPEPVRNADDEWRTGLYPWAFAIREMGTAAEAETIDVPVFVGLGERDLSPAPLDEPARYRSSKDVTVHVVPGARHCFNFASARRPFYERLAGWAVSLAAAAEDR